jgi:hypothetical protein
MVSDMIWDWICFVSFLAQVRAAPSSVDKNSAPNSDILIGFPNLMSKQISEVTRPGVEYRLDNSAASVLALVCIYDSNWDNDWILSGSRVSALRPFHIFKSRPCHAILDLHNSRFGITIKSRLTRMLLITKPAHLVPSGNTPTTSP